MNRYREHGHRSESDELTPSKAWLFAQAILGKPMPMTVGPEARARAKRAELERLAQSSSHHAEELRRLQRAEAEARHEREVLEFAAKISTRAEAELAAIVREETEQCEAWRRAEEFATRLLEGQGLELRERNSYETNSVSIVEWDPNQPRQPAGTPEGGQWSPKGGGASPSSDSVLHRNWDVAAQTVDPQTTTGALSPDATSGTRSPGQDPKAAYLRSFDKGHPRTLRGALQDGKLSAGDIVRLKLADDEIKAILRSAEKPGSDFNQTFYTANNLPAHLRAEAEKDFADLPGDEKYAMQAFISNQRRARTILLSRNKAFQQYVGQLYGLLRSLNPPHFMVEKGIVVATGKEPVLGGEASGLDALKEMLIYLAIMKGVSWGTAKISNIIVGPETAGDIAIAFEGGGKLTIRRGAEYGPETLEGAVERAAAGEKVEINPPAPKPPRPSLTEVPGIKDDPRAFRRWFNELTPEEFKVVWSNPKLRNMVEDGLRWPGQHHEWLMVARTPKFKEWGLTAEQIAEMRTPISKIRFKNPAGGHKGEGATTTHNQILKLIDSSPDFATFKTRLQKWAHDRLEGGAAALPPGLRP